MTVHVGCRSVEVDDPVQGVRLPTSILYPTATAPAPEMIGPYPIEVARDAPAIAGGGRTIILSHGNSSSPWTMRGLAVHLAREGHTVVMVEHLGNSRSDNSLAGTITNLQARPRHLRHALDAIAAADAIVIGHSIGAYTALAAAGARVHTLPPETPDGRPQPVEVERDPRIRAAVLLAPAIDWLGADGSFADVAIPVFVRTGERDVLSPAGRVRWVLRDVARVDHADVPNAGHFSFQSVFPPALTRPDFPPSQDPPGFDRAAYQLQLCAEVAAFVRGVS